MVTRFQRFADMGCEETVENDFNKKVCGGRGECGPNNSCICEIRFTGENCLDYNRMYHAGELDSTLTQCNAWINRQLNFRSRSVRNLLRRCFRVNRAAADLLLRRVQKTQKSHVSQSFSHHNTKVVVFRCVPGIVVASRILHPTRIRAAVMGLLPDVCFLPAADDVRVPCNLLLGWGLCNKLKELW